jgi:hypothetical protein
MAERNCLFCGHRFVPKTGSHVYHNPVCRERAKAQARTVHSPARYGSTHKKLRRAVAVQVQAGGVACARCSELIEPWENWDLDHDDDDPSRYLGPSHRRCNRATAEPESYEDDPERGIYFGPPETDGGTPRRWSRPWYDWRSAA